MPVFTKVIPTELVQIKVWPNCLGTKFVGTVL